MELSVVKHDLISERFVPVLSTSLDCKDLYLLRLNIIIIQITVMYIVHLFGIGPNAVWDVGLRLLAFWEYRLEFRRGHGYISLSLVYVVCCQVEGSATSWSLVQRSPTVYGVYDCDCEASILGRLWLTGGCWSMERGEKFEIGGVWVVERFRQNYIRKFWREEITRAVGCRRKSNVKVDLKHIVVGIWIGIMWLSIRYTGWFLWTQQWTTENALNSWADCTVLRRPLIHGDYLYRI